MKKRLRGYIAYAKELASKEASGSEREHQKKEMLVQISFFQHERLVHLIVTVLFALLTVTGLVGAIALENAGLLVLTGLFLILLIPYIYHYYVLENGVQELYTIYDRL